MKNSDRITQQLLPLIGKIKHHSLYHRITSLAHLRIFMEHHVFAVWDFMCLLKELQRRLVSTHAPWFPPTDAYCAHLINHILLDEEGDLKEDRSGYLSHFEIYVLAMEKIGANTQPVKAFLSYLRAECGLIQAATKAHLPQCVKQFMQTTFSFFTEAVPNLAAAFVYGREAITPSLFTPLVERLEQSLNQQEKASVSTLLYYLKRHIELDDADHFPHAIHMIQNLVGQEDDQWQAVRNSAQRALEARLNFLTSIENAIAEYDQ